MSPQAIFVSATPGNYENEHAGATVEQVVRPTGLVDPIVEIRPARTQVDDLLAEIRETTAKGDRVQDHATKRMSEDLTSISMSTMCVFVICTLISTRLSASKLFAIFAWDILTCSSGRNLLREG